MNHLTIAKRFAEKEQQKNDCFVQQYIPLRQKEGRLYRDEEVIQLPNIGHAHTQYNEWRIRKRSCDRLLRYIRKTNISPDVLEIGCGNGWLTAKIAGATNGNVTGIDINYVEIEQAKRLFGRLPNCSFITGDIFCGALGEQKFDLIVFAASIQYFNSLEDIINQSLEHLTLQGEIHIIDSKFYKSGDIVVAQQRSVAYFNSIGFPGMAAHYHHHTIDELSNFKHRILHDPNRWWNKLIFRRSPFHRIIIKNNYR